MSDNLKWMCWLNMQSRRDPLPDGYGRLYAIMGSRPENAIDSGLLLDPQDEWIVTARRLPDGAGNKPVIGGGYSKTDSNVCLWLNDQTNLVEFTYGDGGSNDWKVLTSSHATTEYHTYRMKLSTGESWLDGEYIGTPAKVSAIPNPTKLIVFGCWRGSSLRDGFPGSIREFIVIRNGVEIRHFVAAFHRGLCGLYDLCGSICATTGTPFYRPWQSYSSYTWYHQLDDRFSVTLDDPAHMSYAFLLKSADIGNGAQVDWGDGTAETLAVDNTEKLYSHTYSSLGSYNVSLKCADVEGVSLTAYNGTAYADGDSSRAAMLRRIDRHPSKCFTANFARGAEQMTLPSSLITKGLQFNDKCFEYCRNVAFDRLSEDAKVMGDVFRATATSVSKLPSWWPEIFGGVFDSCTRIARLQMPSSATLIGSKAFAVCTNLQTDALPDGVTNIGANAFAGCTKLELASLPSGLMSIGELAFYGCSKLALTALPDTVATVNQQAFRDCTLLAISSLPSSLTWVASTCFAGCRGIQSMVIHAGINGVSSSAFSGCTGMTSVRFLGTPTSVDASAFSGCTNLTDIYVPWSEGDVAGAPWGATNATIHYDQP